MKAVDLRVRYIGAVIVEVVVRHNQERYAAPNRSLIRIDLTLDALPEADMVLCRDCLFHLSFDHAGKALKNIKQCGARYPLVTTNPTLEKNSDIVSGEWRRLDLQAAPFSLPKPLLLINENSPHPGNEDKHLGLWKISDL